MKRWFLLDTGMLLGFVREAAWAIRAREMCDLGDRETLLSTDKDFDHLNRVWIRFIYVDQSR